MGRKRALFRALLATTSVAALIVGGTSAARAACASVSATGFVNPAGHTTACIQSTQPTVTGNVVNAGTVSPGGPFGISIGGDSFIGAVINSGTITLPAIGSGIVVSTASTFSGGITNSGTIAAGSNGILVTNASAFAGGISNSGIIHAGTSGIFVGVSTFSGGIANSGTITAVRKGVHVAGGTAFSGGISSSGAITAGSTGILVVGVSTFSGGISNGGTITAAPFGIFAHNAGTFLGGISNSGTVSGTFGIYATNIIQFGSASAGGGITNSGTINASLTTGTGIGVYHIGNFHGGITNSGKISAALGIAMTNGFSPMTSFAGGIANSGTITAPFDGVFITGVVNFSGGITNSGTISAASGNGIYIRNISNFTGGISNSGRISAASTGIYVGGVSSFAGGIVNSGEIAARSGIVVIDGITNFSGGITNSGTISAVRTGLTISVHTFSGDITNTGTISGATGIALVNTPAVSIFDSGSIIGSGGTAIAFGVGPNTLTLAPGYAIVGNVLANSGDTLQLGGASGSDSFNVASIGPTQQYRGFDQFAKIGASSWTLTGTNNLVLPWTVLGGTLNVDKNAALPNSPFTVDAGVFSVDGTVGPVTLNGGTLEGNGTLASLSVHNGAIVAPGHSIGQLNVVGNAGFAAGSIYQVETNAAGQSDKIVAGGNAALTGGTVQALPQTGAYGSSTRYTILTANGGVNGTFSNVTSSLPFLMPSLSYDADDVFLTLTRNTHFLQNQAQTPNQHAVASAIDTFPTGNPLFLDVTALSGSTLLGAFDSLSGEVHASVQSVLIDGSRYFREAILGRLRQADYAGAGGQLAALGIGGPDIVYAYAGREKIERAAMPVKALPMKAPPASEYGVTYWAQGLGAWGHIDSDGNAASVNDNHAGFFTGFDARFGTWRAGLAAGYTRANANIDARASSANVDTAHIGAYAGTQLGALNFRGGAAFAWHSIDTSRSIAFPGFFDQDKASYTGDTTQVFGEVGYGMQFGTIAAEPFAGLTYVHLDTNGFNETGGAAALSGNGASDDVGYSSLGIRAATRLTLADGKTLVPHASVAWQHAFGDVTPAAALAFESTGAAFTVSGVPFARDAVLVQAGIDYLLTANATLTLSYSGELAGTLQDHAVKGDFTWRF